MTSSRPIRCWSSSCDRRLERRSGDARGSPGGNRPELAHVTEDAVELRSLLARWGQSATLALADGRVFVDGRRARRSGLSLSAGVRVEVYSAREVVAGEVRVLGRWGGLAALAKTARSGDGAGSLRHREHGRGARRRALRCRAAASVHACSRLDVGVSGVAWSRSTRRRRAIAAWREQGQVAADVTSRSPTSVPSPTSGVWRHAIGRARGSRRSVGGADATGRDPLRSGRFHSARERCSVSNRVTGRTHQLRVTRLTRALLYMEMRPTVDRGRSSEPTARSEALGEGGAPRRVGAPALEGGVRVERRSRPSSSRSAGPGRTDRRLRGSARGSPRSGSVSRPRAVRPGRSPALPRCSSRARPTSAEGE